MDELERFVFVLPEPNLDLRADFVLPEPEFDLRTGFLGC